MKGDMDGEQEEDKASQPNLVERGGDGHHNKAAAPHGGNNDDVTVKGPPKAQTTQATAKDSIGLMEPVDAFAHAFFSMQLHRLSESSNEGAAQNAQEVLSRSTHTLSPQVTSHRAGSGSTGKTGRPGSIVHKVGRKILQNFGVVHEEEEEEADD